MKSIHTIVKADPRTGTSALKNGRRTTPSRRSFLKSTAAATISASGLLTGCGLSGLASKGGTALRIGFVSPMTGSGGTFGEPNAYVLAVMREALSEGVMIGGTRYSIEVVDRDSRSDPAHARQVTAELISEESIDLMLCTSTPETVNPVSDVCEEAKLPCLSTGAPWESWYFGRGATEEKPFSYTYHFFIGVTEMANALTSLWLGGGLETNKQVGVLWPDDTDGNAMRTGIAPQLKASRFTITDPGGYTDGAKDYTRLITEFIEAETEICTGIPIPADFQAFWPQAREQGYAPKIVSVAKTGLVPAHIEALGKAGHGMTAGFWWTPRFPYTSTLTRQTAQQLADDYQRTTGRQWHQMLGSNVALFEAAVHALKLTSDPKNREELADALGRIDMNTVVGTLDYTAGPVKNVSTEPLVMAQWRPNTSNGFTVEPVIVDKGAFRDITVDGDLEPLQ